MGCWWVEVRVEGENMGNSCVFIFYCMLFKIFGSCTGQ